MCVIPYRHNKEYNEFSTTFCNYLVTSNTFSYTFFDLVAIHKPTQCNSLNHATGFLKKMPDS